MYQDLSIAAAQQAKGQELKLAEYLRKQAEGQFRLRDKIKHAVQTANGSKGLTGNFSRVSGCFLTEFALGVLKKRV